MFGMLMPRRREQHLPHRCWPALNASVLSMAGRCHQTSAFGFAALTPHPPLAIQMSEVFSTRNDRLMECKMAGAGTLEKMHYQE